MKLLQTKEANTESAEVGAFIALEGHTGSNLQPLCHKLLACGGRVRVQRGRRGRVRRQWLVVVVVVVVVVVDQDSIPPKVE